jgi:hypothetical protein
VAHRSGRDNERAIRVNGTKKSMSLRALVEVNGSPGRGWGTGFVLHDRLIVTAARCLPRFPDPTKDHTGDGLGGVKLRSLVNPQLKATALVAFADPVADIAILADYESRNEPANRADAPVQREFNALIDSVPSPLELCFAKLPTYFSSPNGSVVRWQPMPYRVHVYTANKRWVSGVVQDCWPDAVTLQARWSDETPGETSGAPIFNDGGLVIGVFHAGQRNKRYGAFACVPNCLPLRIVESCMGLTKTDSAQLRARVRG